MKVQVEAIIAKLQKLGERAANLADSENATTAIRYSTAVNLIDSAIESLEDLVADLS